MAKKWIIGIDEVGRGPLAGPITVAAAIGPANHKFQITKSKQKLLAGIKNSKKLSAKQREEWNIRLKAYAARYKIFYVAISSVSNKTIDKIGISAAAKLATARCLRKLTPGFKLQVSSFKILLDGGLYAPNAYLNQQTIIKGDEKVPIIAAASIAAKVARDKKMIRLHGKFPAYGFDIHKGYGTRKHQKAIKRLGLCALHRKTFCRKFAKVV